MAMIAAEVAITAIATSFAPTTDASLTGIPSSSFLKIFSRTTIASSTTSPTQSDSASSVRMLMEKPAMAISMNAPISEFGMAKPVMTVDRMDPRKK